MLNNLQYDFYKPLEYIIWKGLKKIVRLNKRTGINKNSSPFI